MTTFMHSFFKVLWLSRSHLKHSLVMTIMQLHRDLRFFWKFPGKHGFARNFQPKHTLALPTSPRPPRPLFNLDSSPQPPWSVVHTSHSYLPLCLLIKTSHSCFLNQQLPVLPGSASASSSGEWAFLGLSIPHTVGDVPQHLHWFLW